MNKFLICATVALYLFFGSIGAFAALIISLVISAKTTNKPNISWPAFQIYTHASWILPCLLGLVCFILFEPLRHFGVLGAVEKIRAFHLPWDRISEAMLSNDSTTAKQYSSAYFGGQWKSFYPAAQIGLIFGSAVYGASLAVLASRDIIPIKGTSVSNEYWRSVYLALSVCLLASIGTQFFEWSILPNGRRFLSRMSPLVVFAMTWTLMLFVAVLCHALLSKFVKKEWRCQF